MTKAAATSATSGGDFPRGEVWLHRAFGIQPSGELRIEPRRAFGTEAVGDLGAGMGTDVGLHVGPASLVITNLVTTGADGDDAPAG